MRIKYSIRIFFLFVIILATRLCSFAQADQIEHLWYNEEKTAKILVYKATDGKFYGKIVWLKDPNRDGKPKTDINNPDKARQDDPEMGLVILKNFQKDGVNGYQDGTIYDPKNGKTYSCKMTINGNELDVRGFVGVSLFGRTTKWTRAD
jgi:uncharacterized protein (DUF2147 family)